MLARYFWYIKFQRSWKTVILSFMVRPSNGYSLRSASHESHFVALYSSDAAPFARCTLSQLHFLALSCDSFRPYRNSSSNISGRCSVSGSAGFPITTYSIFTLNQIGFSNLNLKLRIIKSYNIYYNIINIIIIILISITMFIK